MRWLHHALRVAVVAGLCVGGLGFEPRQDPQRSTSYPVIGPASLAAQVSFCSTANCSCGNAAERQRCRDEQKANFEANNPPRGPVTGVCYAWRYRWERDPATGQQVQRTSTQIFTRVRFNETEVLALDYHGRNAGFRHSVESAWREFVRTQAPETDGWAWVSHCVVLDKPLQREDEAWRKAQEQMSFQRVFMPTYGIADTPEERALEAKLTAERKAREAEIARQEELKRREAAARAAEAERQRLAAEAARKAELARIEAQRQKKVDAIAKEIGPGKRDAAERLQKMNEELAALRPKPRVVPKKNDPSRQCTRPAYTTKWSTGPGLTELKDARAEYATLAAKACQGRGGNVGPIQCGNVVTVFGTPFTSCQATISCAAYTDSDCGAKVSPQ